MYCRYARSQKGQELRYDWVENISLFGRNEGYIPWLLSQNMDAEQDEPFKWHIDIDEALSKANMPGQALVIDLKPSNTVTLNLYEVADVWGFSSDGWTPIMLRLRGLFVERILEGIDRHHFSIRQEEIDEPIFSFLFLAGSVQAGKLIGTWIAPRPSPTNSALLWPETFRYFAGEAEQFLPPSASTAPLTPLVAVS